MRESGATGHNVTYAERLRALEVALTRLTADYQEFSQALKEVRQIGQSTERLLNDYGHKFDGLGKQLHNLADGLSGTVARVQAIETSTKSRHDQETVAGKVRQAHINMLYVALGIAVSAVGMWSSRIANWLADAIKLLPGRS